ncbi:ADP-heptose:LPS heptosyltransferase [Parelusimicrobium proximum]|uniref:glycosyltransferase family 9 protein n=1 Tax=Parelusimicrobium proximum TaxID=3228953 RepID=UPI003D16B1F3
MAKRILLVRTDRIGDLISITPAISVLKKNFPHAYIAVLASKYASGAVINNPMVDEVIVKEGFWKTLKKVRAGKFDTAVIFFLDAYAGLITFLARIPLRIGPVSKIWAIFLNKRITQKRSKTPDKHESDFNLDLLKPLFVFYYPASTYIHIPRRDITKAKKYLKDTFAIIDTDKLVIIHPGSKGSAKNWPADNYAELTQKIMTHNPELKVLLTGGPDEQKLLAEIAAKLEPKPFVLTDALPLTEFMAVINQADIFISNSTGPLHIAAALKKRTLSFYPMIKGCLPSRWGPYGTGHIILMPPADTCGKCAPECTQGGCMSLITVDEAYAAFEKQLK